MEFVERSRSDAPEFLKKIGDEMVFRGMAARFTALVTGIPEPEYEWVFNGRPLFPTDRYLLKFTQTYSNLLKFTQIYSDLLKFTQIYSNILRFTQIYSIFTLFFTGST